MTFLDSIILSIVEGITEFLPVSSTGHLILTSKLLNINQTKFIKSFEIYIQLGAILAVVILYWRRFLQDGEVLKKVMVAFLPTAIIGLFFYKFIKQFLLGNLVVTVLALLIGGILLIILEKNYSETEDNIKDLRKISLKQSFLIGVSQAISVVPGVSRSGASILGGMYLGASRKVAVEFSFLLAVPTMMAATGLDLIKANFNYTLNQWGLIFVGFIGSFITALIVIKWFTKYVTKSNFVIFGVYRIALALLFLGFMLN